LKPVEKYEDVQINGRTFRIKKFDAMTGSFMVIKITGIIAPLFKNLDLNKYKDVTDPSVLKLDALNISGIMQELGSLSEEDFSYVQEKCLRVCSEVLPAAVTPVLNKDKTFGVMGLEEDTMAVFALTVHALIFNLKGFFQGSPLSSLMGGLLSTSPQG
jgi:hypothetical protein